MLQKSFVRLQINQISTNFDLFNSLTKRVLPNDNSASLQLFIEIQLVLALTKSPRNFSFFHTFYKKQVIDFNSITCFYYFLFCKISCTKVFIKSLTPYRNCTVCTYIYLIRNFIVLIAFVAF